jgi:hypothetical protein
MEDKPLEQEGTPEDPERPLPGKGFDPRTLLATIALFAIAIVAALLLR